MAARPAPADSSWDDWDDEDDPAPSRSQPPIAGVTPQPSPHAAFRDNAGMLCLGPGATMDVGLRCTSCGQRVHRFDAHRWDESADYYTFRNYSPDDRMPHKLQEDLAKLARWLRPAGGAAYACSCSWQSIGRMPKPLEGDEGTLAAPHGGARFGEAEPRLKWAAA